ncbi:MAG TPA: MATE family efflux transporter, partial [Candidatus Saccharimonadales bacterium]|nr:MATE family efflux transporter [Candidatus Saccharimonadales bacterium]
MPATDPINPSPTVLRMAAPLVVSFVMRAAFTLVDTVYAALIGDAAVAGIGIAVPFEFVMIAIWVGLSTGLTSCLSRAMGAREGRKIQQYLKVAWTLTWIVSPAFLLLGAWIWLGFPKGELSKDVYDAFRVYGAVLIGGSAFTAFWSVIPDSVVKAHHDTRSTMWAGIISNVINLALNTLFLFVFHWGMFGIAFSTVLGRIGGLVYALGRARYHEDRRKAGGDPGVALDPAPYRAILALAVPSSLGFVLMASETAVINLLLSFLKNNTEALAAYSIYYRVVLFALNPVIAASVALLPYTARRFGERDIGGVRRGLRETLMASAAYSLGLVAPLMFFGSGRIASWLGESPVTTAYAALALKMVPLACLLGAPFLLCRPIFEGMQRGRPGLLMAALRYVILTVPFS